MSKEIKKPIKKPKKETEVNKKVFDAIKVTQWAKPRGRLGDRVE